MRVERKSLLVGAEQARGIAVVIDVLRAFSCSALMFHYGVRDLALWERNFVEQSEGDHTLSRMHLESLGDL